MASDRQPHELELDTHPNIATPSPASPSSSTADRTPTSHSHVLPPSTTSTSTTTSSTNLAIPSRSSHPRPSLPSRSSTTTTTTSDTDVSDLETDLETDTDPMEDQVSRTTITTQKLDRSGGRTGRPNTTEVTHSGAKRVEHQIEKDGTVSLHPVAERKSGGKKERVKVRKVVTFQPRWSQFDRQNLATATDPFRGFYVLFWILLGVGAIRTFYTSYKDSGAIPGLSFGSLISRDGRVLALSDAIMVASTFLCVPFAKLLKNGWIGNKMALTIQHVGQGLFLGTAIRWTFYRSWPWVQSGYMTLHTITMLMKIQSYTSYNMELFSKSRQFDRTISDLRKALLAQPGSSSSFSSEKNDGTRTERSEEEDAASSLELALDEARENREEKERREREKEEESGHKVHENGNGNGHSFEENDGTATPQSETSSTAPSIASATSTLDPRTATHTPSNATLRHRPTSSHDESPSPSHSRDRSHSSTPLPGLPASANISRTATSLIASSLTDSAHPTRSDIFRRRETLATLAHHPEPSIAALASQAADLDEELTSSGPAEVRWPANVTYRNFWDYLLVPTLVYELEYPRTNRIRPLYVLEKTLATFGTFSLLLVCTEHYILPYTPQKGDSFVEGLVNLCVPFMINYLLIFYIIFECICNAFAELTCFADREFYSDWWNSTSFDEFSRRWNKPVHMFLLRHVYASTRTTYGISKLQASFVTFLLSACFHELVMVVVTKKIRPYLFLMQMAQLPLIMIGRHPFFRKNPTIGNMFFWFGLMTGFPLLAVSYLTM